MKYLLDNWFNKMIYFIFSIGASTTLWYFISIPSLPFAIQVWQKNKTFCDLITIIYTATKPNCNDIIKPLYSMECLYTLGKIRANIIVKKLTGGLSGTSLYTIDIQNKKYVLRTLICSVEDKTREINAQMIASQTGWGPKLHGYNIDEGWILMDYLQPSILTDAYRTSDQMYIDLGKLLQKIHNGPSFLTNTPILIQIEETLERLYNTGKIPTIFLYSDLKKILTTAKKKYQTTITPTHRDLNPNNIIFSNNQFFVIDFESASQDDPFYDLATIGIFYIFNPNHEQIILNSYLNRAPTKTEVVHYRRMRQTALLFYGLNFLNRIPSESIINDSFNIEPYEQVLQKIGQGLIDIGRPIGQLTAAISILQKAIDENKATKL